MGDQRWDGDFGLGWFVSPLDTDAIHGLVCVSRRTSTTVEVSYGIAPDRRGHGLATAVLAEVPGTGVLHNDIVLMRESTGADSCGRV